MGLLQSAKNPRGLNIPKNAIPPENYEKQYGTEMALFGQFCISSFFCCILGGRNRGGGFCTFCIFGILCSVAGPQGRNFNLSGIKIVIILVWTVSLFSRCGMSLRFRLRLKGSLAIAVAMPWCIEVRKGSGGGGEARASAGEAWQGIRVINQALKKDANKLPFMILSQKWKN